MSDTEDYVLTTVNNPYNPYTQWDDWFAWDYAHGYHTPGALARQVVTSDDLSDMDQALAINQAIDELVELNPTGLYKKISRESMAA